MSALFTGMKTLYNLRQSISNLGGLESDLGNINRELNDMKREIGDNASETGEESSIQQNGGDNVIDGSSTNNVGNMDQTPIIDENGVGTIVQNLKKENNKITSKSKKIKEKNTRESINPRLDSTSRSDRNWRVRRKSSPVVLNQKGPVERDMDIPEPNIVVAEKTKVKRIWYNPTTWFGGNNNSTTAGSGNNNTDLQGLP